MWYLYVENVYGIMYLEGTYDTRLEAYEVADCYAKTSTPYTIEYVKG